MKRILELDRLAPPGANTEPQKLVLMFGLICSGIFSFFQFPYRLAQELEYRRTPEGLVTGETMPPFFRLLGGSLAGFGVVALLMLFFAATYRLYYQQGARTIYLVRRLPDRGFFHRSCWALPVLGAAVCGLAAALTLLLYLVVYLWLTPEQLLPGYLW